MSLLESLQSIPTLISDFMYNSFGLVGLSLIYIIFGLLILLLVSLPATIKVVRSDKAIDLAIYSIVAVVGMGACVYMYMQFIMSLFELNILVTIL